MSPGKWWWLSWEEMSPDYRPLRDPPAEAVLAWWCSGEDMEGAHFLVALVEARTEAGAKRAVDMDWPAERRVWRFCREQPVGERPGDRFPLKGWALERVKASERRGAA